MKESPFVKGSETAQQMLIDLLCLSAAFAFFSVAGLHWHPTQMPDVKQ